MRFLLAVNNPLLIVIFFGISFGLKASETSQCEDVLDSLIRTSWALKYEDTSESLRFVKEALVIAEKCDDLKAEGTCHNIIGVILRISGEFYDANSNFQKALELRSFLKDSIGMASVYNNLGTLYLEKGEYEKSLQFLLKATKIYENINRHDKLGRAYLNIANTYGNAGNHDKSIQFYQLSITKLEDDSLNIANCYYGLAVRYLGQNKIDKAKAVIEQAKSIYSVLGTPNDMADSYDVFAQIAIRESQYLVAENYYKKAIKIYEDHIGNDIDLFTAYVNFSVLKEKQKEYENALIYLKKAKKIIGDKSSKVHQLRLAINLTDVYAHLGQFDSMLIYKNRERSFRDSVYKFEQAKAMEEMEAKYENEKLEKENINQKLENQKAITQRNTLLSLFLVVFGITVFGYNYFRQKQKSAATITLQKEKIHQQEVQELLKTQELTAINSMLEGQEQERIRIAKDLHDRLGSMLTTVKWNFESYLDEEKEINKEPLEKASDMLDDAYQEVRRIAHNMVSGVLNQIRVGTCIG